MIIYYCTKCNKEVFIMGMSHSTSMEDKLEGYYERAEKMNKILLVNPVPNEPFHCPICFSELEFRETSDSMNQ